MSAWCTQAEIEDLLSATGVSVSTNDNMDNAVSDALIVSNAIERGQSRLGQYLIGKYDTDIITSSNVWVKWANAAFAAIEIMRRKGGVVPLGLQEIYEEYIDILKDVKDGTGLIPGLVLRTSPGISVANITLDNYYNRAKIRKVETISWPLGLVKLPHFRDRADIGNTY